MPYKANIGEPHKRGIIVLVHRSISHLILQIKPKIQFEEALLLEIAMAENDDMMLFGCFYRSPTVTKENKCEKNKNNEDMNKLIKELSQNPKYTHICLVGDFNYGKINWEYWSSPCEEDSNEERFLDALRDSYLYQHVLEPTRQRRSDKPSTLDLILTGEENQITKLKYLAPLDMSDHSVLSFIFNGYFNPKQKQDRFQYDKVNYNAIRNYLGQTNWSIDILQRSVELSVKESWDLFKSKLIELRNLYVPISKNTSDFPKKGKIPLSQNIRDIVKEKARKHRKWIKSLNHDNERRCRQEYVTIRNKVTKALTRSKRDYEKNISNQSNRNPKRFWKYIRSNLKTKSGIHPLLKVPNDESSIKYDDKNKADILQDQFCSVFTQEPLGDLPEFQSRTDTNVQVTILTETIKEELKALNVNKSIGPDELHPRMLRELADYIAEPLFSIMTKSLREGCLPDDWKIANVSPVYKKGNKNLAENYRPISLTSIVCRVMEKIIKTQIMTHLQEQKLLSTRQHGFINRRSTVTQLLNYLDCCAEDIANGKAVDAVYFDFAKAFDTVPHQRLLLKLEAYGIRNEPLNWIKDFLNDRHQIVKVNGIESEKRKVLSGVPQGSVLGPILFVVYINDLPEAVKSRLFLFADDTKLLNKVENVEDALLIQDDINALQKWSDTWLLKFHADKCHVLTIGKPHMIKYTHDYSLGGNVLKHVTFEKDLGVIFDKTLSFEQHISNQVKKANSMAGLIRRSFTYLTPELFRKLYITFVRPHLEYAQVVWSPKFKKHTRLIEGVQRRATKTVEKCKSLSYVDRMKKIGIPSLNYRRAANDMVEVFKHLNYYDKASIPSNFDTRKRPNRTHDNELIRIFANDGVRGAQSNCFYYRSIKQWNSLPQNIVQSSSVDEFKDKIKLEWQNKMYEHD